MSIRRLTNPSRISSASIIGAGGVYAATPFRFSGLQLWLDASDSTTLFDATSGGSLPANGAAVARWQDKSGNANHMTQSTANNRPTRATSSLNGLDGLTFDGTNDSLFRSCNVYDTTVSVFAVASFDDNTSRRPILDINTANVGANAYFTIEQNTFSTVGSRYGMYGTGSATDSNLATSSGGKIFSLTADASSGNSITSNTTYRVNGQAGTLTVRSGGGNYASATNLTGVAIGAYNNDGAGGVLWMKGKIYEILVYSTRLSATDITVVESYLSTKWGVSV